MRSSLVLLLLIFALILGMAMVPLFMARRELKIEELKENLQRREPDLVAAWETMEAQDPPGQMSRVVLADSYFMKSNEALENTFLDARFLDGKPAVVCQGDTNMINHITIRNVKICCRDNPGVVLRSETGGMLDFNRLDVTVVNASVGMLLEPAGGQINNNEIQLTTFNCGAVLEMRPGNTVTAMSGNQIRLTAQRKGGGGVAGKGALINGSHNILWSPAFWNWDLSTPAVVLGEQSRYTRVYGPLPSYSDLGEFNSMR